jgi:hypothetical protein
MNITNPETATEPGQTKVLKDILNFRTTTKFQAVLANPPSGLTIGTKRKLAFLKNNVTGILFLWSDKTDIAEWLQVFEANKFCYIENMAWVMVKPDVLEESNATKDFTSEFLFRSRGQPFACSHRTLLMFRRMPPTKLEIRH